MSPKKQVKMKARKTKRRKYDSAWKEVIEKRFENFLEFFFPDLHAAIDFSKKIEFLDTGMRPIAIFSDMGDRAADVLVKVHLKDGTYRYICIFIHIEVQAQPLINFMEKMYIYNYRIFDKRIEAGVPVISVAILTDDNENYRPNEYVVDFCGFELRMKIPIVKIIDFRLKKELREKLETSANPMALVVRAQLKSLEVNKADDNTKFNVAKELIRECYKQGYSKKEIQTLAKFIEWVIRLSKTLEKRLKEEIKKIEEEFNMPYLASWERSAKREGKIEGKIEGKTEEKLETAKRMLLDNISIEKVIKYTGLTEKEVKALMN
jgi:predicted transposase/invertase (TIGR01784 family)